jgi:hypothetical protein
MFEKGVHAGEMQSPFQAQWRHPNGIVLVDFPRKINKGPHVPFGTDRYYIDAARIRQGWLLGHECVLEFLHRGKVAGKARILPQPAWCGKIWRLVDWNLLAVQAG